VESGQLEGRGRAVRQSQDLIGRQTSRGTGSSHSPRTSEFSVIQYVYRWCEIPISHRILCESLRTRTV
jgi:hypothetical protein